MYVPFSRPDQSFPLLRSLGLALSLFAWAPAARAEGKPAATSAAAPVSSASRSAGSSSSATSSSPTSTTTPPRTAANGSAAAQTPQAGAASQDPATDARVLYLKGNAAFKRGDDILARDYYQKSLALRESFDTYCNLGRAEDLSALS
ncbi:MAG TPA: tetratricopeptide repeat protein, partial [Polyangiaceae bacterium]|nr:tetratricopeptide repeat protein [Polyangiaceae bacterium]